MRIIPGKNGNDLNGLASLQNFAFPFEPSIIGFLVPVIRVLSGLPLILYYYNMSRSLAGFRLTVTESFILSPLSQR